MSAGIRLQARRGAVAARPKFQAIAEDLALQIGRGVPRAGERVPSVRRIAVQHRVSISTAMAALRALEARGLIEPRPKSGFYVRAPLMATQEPRHGRPPLVARSVSVDRLSARVFAASLDPAMAPLGSAIADVDWFPGKRLQRLLTAAARRHPEALLRYGPLAGLPALRHRIAKRYLDLGCALDEDEIVITNGCTEALNLALRAVADRGDVIAIESPCYFGFLEIIESLGMRAMEIPTHPRDGLSVDGLETALQSPAGQGIRACLVTSSFSNPSGATMPEAAKRALLQLCARRGVALIEDDIYADLQHSGPRPRPAKSFDEGGDVLLCSSFSKTLAPGVRVGWIAAGRHTARVLGGKNVLSMSTALPLQYALEGLLAGGGYERHLQRMRQRSAAQVAATLQAVASHFPEGTRVAVPAGGAVLWIELPRGCDSLVLHERALRERINFAPGCLFSPSGRYRNFLRLNCAHSQPARVEQALQRLGRLAARLA